MHVVPIAVCREDHREPCLQLWDSSGWRAVRKRELTSRLHTFLFRRRAAVVEMQPRRIDVGPVSMLVRRLLSVAGCARAVRGATGCQMIEHDAQPGLHGIEYRPPLR